MMLPANPINLKSKTPPNGGVFEKINWIAG
jgi:hypothetical protein